MGWLEQIIAAISPGWAAERARDRAQLQAYEAANIGRNRKFTRESRSGNSAVRNSAKTLREQARWLEESHDLVVAMLDVFVANVVGPNGIQIEPQPRTRGGELHEDFARSILELRRDWSENPETRAGMDNGMMERLVCRTWARDGESFAQHLQGAVAGLDHYTRVPYSLELIEPDVFPLDYDRPSENVIQAIGTNRWGQPQIYYAYETHPGDTYYKISTALRTINAAQIQHIKNSGRIGQLRGITRLAPAMLRLQDLKDYEESERVAARLAAAQVLYIKKGTPDLYEQTTLNTNDDGERLFNVAPGAVWDRLQPGEDVGTINPGRPSGLLTPFRDAMIRAAAGGVGVGYSSSSKTYDGTYSAQRQELVEQAVLYAGNTSHFVAQWTRPVYQRFIATAIASRQLQIPRSVDPLTIDDAEYRGPAMPWIDPQKEAQANLIQVQAGFKSRAQVIRERNGNPVNVTNEIKRERDADREKSLVFSSDFIHEAATAAMGGELPPDDSEELAA